MKVNQKTRDRMRRRKGSVACLNGVSEKAGAKERKDWRGKTRPHKKAKTKRRSRDSRATRERRTGKLVNKKERTRNARAKQTKARTRRRNGKTNRQEARALKKRGLAWSQIWEGAHNNTESGTLEKRGAANEQRVEYGAWPEPRSTRERSQPTSRHGNMRQPLLFPLPPGIQAS